QRRPLLCQPAGIEDGRIHGARLDRKGLPRRRELQRLTREGYDLWSQIYDDEDNPLIALETAWVTRLLGDVRGLAVADVGCGTGRHAIAMAAAGGHVGGVDFSPGMLAKFRATPGAGAVRLVPHDLTTGLPFASGSMDRVTCCLVLEHVTDLASAFTEMSRICRAGGFVPVSALP